MSERSPGLPREAEADVQRQVIDYLRCLGLDFDRQNTGVGTYENADGTTRRVRFGRKGDSDICGMLNDGRAFMCEAKRPGKRPTREQMARIDRTNTQGGVAFWTDNLSHVMSIMPHILDGASVEETADERGPRVECRPGCRACGGRG